MIEFNSYASGLMFDVTCYRNFPGFLNKVIAVPAYAVCALTAAVESVAALALTAIKSCRCKPESDVQKERAIKWLNSSSFCLGWAVADFILNPLTHTLVADEPSARLILQNRDFFRIPKGAII